MASRTLTSSTPWLAPSALTSFIASEAASHTEDGEQHTQTSDLVPETRLDGEHGEDAARTKPYQLHLALQVQHNLIHQHDWTDVRLHTRSSTLVAALDPSTSSLATESSTGGSVATSELLPRALLTGIPPGQLYTHPSVLTALIKQDLREKSLPVQAAVVCPAHLKEREWTLRSLGGVMDCLPEPVSRWRELEEGLGLDEGEGRKLDGAKRVLLGIVEHDGTVVYYWAHDGTVKPRQN